MTNIRFIIKMKRIFFIIATLVALLAACTDNDSFTTSRNNILTFSTDTLKMDTVFSNVGSSTYTFWVFNRSTDGLRLSSVRLKGGNQTGFRVNVDGSYLDNTLGSVVTDLEVRKGDSLRVFVELTSPETQQHDPVQLSDELLFQLESGVEQSVHLEAWAWDAVKITDLNVTADTLIESTVPLVFYGSGIKVDSGAVLTLRNTTLYFHDQAGIDVYGSLIADNALLRGDRLDHMFDYLPYDRVSGQWRGLWFAPSSKTNTMTDTEIRNACHAIVLSDSCDIDTIRQRLTMTRCVVHNAKGYGLISYHSNVALVNCQFTNTLDDCLAVYGGICTVDHCTLGQFYPFTANRGAALRFSNVAGDTVYPLLKLLCRGTIVTGYESDVVFLERADTSAADTLSSGVERVFTYQFDDCLLRTPKVEDDTVSFHNIMWETPEDSIQGKQHFAVFDEKNLYYDFHLDSLSTAKGKGCYPAE